MMENDTKRYHDEQKNMSFYLSISSYLYTRLVAKCKIKNWIVVDILKTNTSNSIGFQ